MASIVVHHKNTAGSIIGETTSRSIEEVHALVAEGFCPCNIYWHTPASVAELLYRVRDQILPHLDGDGRCPLCKCSWTIVGSE